MKNKLLKVIELILKNNILTEKELKLKIMGIIRLTNDTRMIRGLMDNILEGKIESLKETDIESLYSALSKLVDESGISTEEANKDVTNEQIVKEEVVLINKKDELNKITGIYNEALIEIQKLKRKLEEKESLEFKINQLESKLKKYENLNIDQILEENKLLSQMFKITGTQIKEVPDDDIDALYIRYKTQGIRQYGKAFITEDEIIPKSYYDLKGGK
jgi:hypothetical protein